MNPSTIGYISIIVLVILLFSGLHIGITMGLLGFLGMALLIGWPGAFGIMKLVPYSTVADYNLSVIPLFVLMGELCALAGISSDLYNTVYKLLGKLRGGLAITTIGACAAFASVSGSSMATAATMGTVALPEMKKYKYGSSLATGALAAGGTIGILIPPSVPMIIYGISAEQSIGKLFLAGFIPGIIQAVLFIVVIVIWCRINPAVGPSGLSTSIWEKIASLKNTWIVIALFLLVIGGIYFGVFSPTEAAGIGACGAFLFALGRRRLTLRKFGSALLETSKTSAMIFFIVIGAIMLGNFLAVTRLPFNLATFIGALPVNNYVILLFVIILYLFLGCIMDTLAMILLTVPILYPVMLQLGFDPIWFGIMVVVMAEIGMITPPVGMNVFVIKGMASEVPTYTIFRGIVPFLFADLVLVSLLVVWPQIALILPHMMKY